MDISQLVKVYKGHSLTPLPVTFLYRHQRTVPFGFDQSLAAYAVVPTGLLNIILDIPGGYSVDTVYEGRPLSEQFKTRFTAEVEPFKRPGSPFDGLLQINLQPVTTVPSPINYRNFDWSEPAVKTQSTLISVRFVAEQNAPTLPRPVAYGDPLQIIPRRRVKNRK